LKDVIINQYISDGGCGLQEDDCNLAVESAVVLGLRTTGLWGSAYPEESKRENALPCQIKTEFTVVRSSKFKSM